MTTITDLARQAATDTSRTANHAARHVGRLSVADTAATVVHLAAVARHLDQLAHHLAANLDHHYRTGHLAHTRPGATSSDTEIADQVYAAIDALDHQTRRHLTAAASALNTTHQLLTHLTPTATQH